MNNHLILVAGSSTTGKSWSLKDIKDHKGVMYLCTESNKNLPFKNDFVSLNITDPHTLVQAFEEAESMENIHTIVVDSLTFMFDQNETYFVHESDDSRAGWGHFAEFFKKLMLKTIANSTKNVIFTAHTITIYNQEDMVMETKIPIKGSLKNSGIEAFFSFIISTKRLPITELEEYKNDLLTITEDEEILGFKHVFQTRLTRDTVNERIRGPNLMWAREETFINNDIQLILDRLNEYYS